MIGKKPMTGLKGKVLEIGRDHLVRRLNSPLKPPQSDGREMESPKLLCSRGAGGE